MEALQAAYNRMVRAVRRSRADLADLNRDLEGLVVERTSALEARTVELSASVARVEQARRQIAAALDVAERAGRAKSDFLALLSHELRPPRSEERSVGNEGGSTCKQRGSRDHKK